jgi:hypothetical protein
MWCTKVSTLTKNATRKSMVGDVGEVTFKRNISSVADEMNKTRPWKSVDYRWSGEIRLRKLPAPIIGQRHNATAL